MKQMGAPDSKRGGVAPFPLALFISALLLPASLLADIYTYQNTLLGERSAGMGGAYTALSEDPSGLYYNPAGIAFIEKRVFSLSASVLELKAKTYEEYLYGRDFTELSMNLFPSTYGSIRQLWGGTGGVSIMVTEDSYYRVNGRMEDLYIDGRESILTVDNTLRDRTYNVGLSYARRFLENLSIGGTIYYFYRVLNYSFFYLLDDVTGGASTGESIRMEEVKQGIVFHSGVKYKFREWIEAGLVMRSGGNLASTGSRRSTTFTEWGEVISEETGTGGEVSLPFSATLGVAFRLEGGWLFSIDLSGYEGGEARVPVMNLNMGMEKFITPLIPIRCGFFTNRSSAPEIDEGGSPDQAERIDQMGITVGSGMIGQNTSTTANLIISGGGGEAPGIPEGGGTENYSITQGGISLVISGSYWF